MNKLSEKLFETWDKWFPIACAVGAVLSVVWIYFIIRVLLYAIDFFQNGGSINISLN
ncbi:hypothetical protein Barb6_00148 [Bacteroidales bacterium Barb6]|nr:hypothetical protein Barb6_00173 [Bacteroidales bacterium Barb6]OAV73543.1 hypothetical protein Barb6_00148 [Bacteroidales bacterium Barb6]